MMHERVALDLSRLPTCGKQTASPAWWGTLGFMLLEGTGFALVIAIYLYLLSIAPHWPIDAPPPDLAPGTIVTVLLLASVLPNHWLSRWAAAEDLRKVRIGIVIMSAFGIAPLIVRAFEFPALNILWDANAYGSTVWLMLGLHTTHLVTDIVDTLVLGALMFTRHGTRSRRFSDVQDNALYWDFVVVSWLPIYACIYWAPQL
jgi:heme/copper-type cytochrome/quinol oxidase subunit 3